MTTDLPDPHACPHCGTVAVGYANAAGVRLCLNCRAPRTTAEPGCPVRNAMATESDRKMVDELHAFFDACLNLGVADETARERKVHGGGRWSTH